jgi:hypothetical protein
MGERGDVGAEKKVCQGAVGEGGESGCGPSAMDIRSGVSVYTGARRLRVTSTGTEFKMRTRWTRWTTGEREMSQLGGAPRAAHARQRV